MASFIIGYLIIINILSYIWIWILSETDYIKLSDGILNTIFIIQTLIGGFVGLLVASKMLSS
jgi:Na+/alanine symporter